MTIGQRIDKWIETQSDLWNNISDKLWDIYWDIYHRIKRIHNDKIIVHSAFRQHGFGYQSIYIKKQITNEEVIEKAQTDVEYNWHITSISRNGESIYKGQKWTRIL